MPRSHIISIRASDFVDCSRIDDKKSSRPETNFDAHHVQLFFLFLLPMILLLASCEKPSLSADGGMALSVTCHLLGN